MENAINHSRRELKLKKDVFVTILKVLSIIFAFVFLWRTLSKDYWDKSAYTILEIVGDRSTGIVNRGRAVTIGLIRMFTNGTCLLVITSSFFNIPYLKKAVRYFAPITAVINLLLANVIIYHIYLAPGAVDGITTYFRAAQFYTEHSLVLLISILNWIVYFVYDYKKPEQKFIVSTLKSIKWSSVWRILLVYLFLSIICAPLSTMLSFFGPANFAAIDLNLPHRIMLYIIFLTPFILMFVFRYKSYETRYFLCLSIALASFYCYFSYYEFVMFKDITTLPFHLCNMAVVIMFIAFVFRNKPCFYFNYLINVLGGLLAALMPETTGDLFYFVNMRFWHNHITIILLPLLAVGLKIFSRPTIKMWAYSVVIFSLYFFMVAGIDAYFGERVNYFFLNTDKITSHVGFLKPLRDQEKYLLIIAGKGENGKDMIIYIWYWLVIYVGYCGLALGTWFVYSLFYRISDSHYELMVRMKKAKLLANEKGKIKIDYRQEIEKIGDEPGMIKIDHLTKIYGKDKKKAVDDFSLEIHSGDVYGFLGHNGAGKSTLIKCLIGAQPITSGSISIYGHDITKEPIITKMLIGYVPDNHAVYEGLTGREYVNYIADLFLVSTEDRKERLKKYSELFEITKALDKPIKSYSHGMKQKITIIAALIHNPKVWVLDEPLTGLDPKSIYQIKECMKEHAAKGNIVFFSSHVIDVVENVCTKICVISHGQLRGEFDLKELKKQGVRLEDIYLKYVQNADRDE